MINNEKKTVIKFGTHTVNVLCQLQVTHYIIKIFTVECNLSLKLRSHSFLDI